MPKLPPSLYGPDRHGLGDPSRRTLLDRITRSTSRLQTEEARRASRSPAIRALQAASDRALGRSR
jgi:hypothetical protein